MNWYKESQQIMEREEHGKNYFEIGHSMYNQNVSELSEPDIVWVWDGGTLHSVTGEYRRTHEDVREGYKRMYSGRYENKNGVKNVSIRPPDTQRYRDIPNGLIRDLVDQFGDDIRINIFR